LTYLATALLSTTETLAFIVPSAQARSTRKNLQPQSGKEVCDVPAIEVDSLVGIPNGARSIKSAVVTNADGDIVKIDNLLARDKPNVVIYLRHMG